MKAILLTTIFALFALALPVQAGEGHAHSALKNKKTDKIARKITEAPLRIVREVRLNIPAEELFALIEDHEALPKWVPFIHQVKVDNSHAKVPGGYGAVRTCTTADGQEVTEDIVHLKPGRALAYAIRDDNNMGLTNHVGVMVVTKGHHGEARFTWSQYFNHPMPDQAVQGFGQIMDMVLNGLVERHGGEMLAAR